MRSLVAVVLLVGCLPTHIKPYVEPVATPEEPVYELAPYSFGVSDSVDNVFSRSAQIAATLEMNPTEMNKASGLMRAQFAQPVVGERGAKVMRVMTMTVLIGAGTATVSSAVTICTRLTPATCTEPSKALNALEAQKLKDFILRVEAVSNPPVKTYTRPPAEL